MKKTFLLYFLISCFFFACKKENTSQQNILYTYVPADATVIANIQSGQLRKKIDWAYLNASPAMAFLKLSMKDNMLLKYIFNGDATGIDFDKEVLLYAKVDTSAGEAKTFAVMPMKDKSKFEATIKELTKTEKFSQSSNYSFCTGPGMIAGWTDEIALIVWMPQENADGAFLAADLESAFTKNNPMPKDDKVFADFMTKKADINICGDQRFVSRVMPEGAGSKIFQNTKGIYSISFNKGDVTIDCDVYPQDAKGKEMLAGVLNRKPENNMTQYLPDAYTMLMQVSTEPDKVLDYINIVAGKDVLEEIKNEIDSNLTKEDIAAILNKLEGDVIVSTGNMQADEPDFILSVSTKENNVMEAVKKFAKNFTITQNGDVTVFVKDENIFYAKEKNNVLTVARNSAALEQATDGNKSGQSQDGEVSEAMTKNPFVLYVDAQKIFENIGTSQVSSFNVVVGNLLKYGVVVAEPMQDDKAHGILKVQLTYSDDYSINVILKTILESTGKIFN